MKIKALILLILHDQEAYELIRFIDKVAMDQEIERTLETLICLREAIHIDSLKTPAEVIQITSKKKT